MQRITLENEEIVHIKKIISEVTSVYSSVEENEFINNVSIFAHELPRRLRAFISNYKYHEPEDGVVVISGYPIDQKKIGNTPLHWKYVDNPSPALEEEIYLHLCSSLLGDAIGWATQQNGYIINNVLPIQGHENEQLGSGSAETLVWHTEDVFHPYRGDYLSMLCLRNPYNAPTICGYFDPTLLDEGYLKILFEPRFIIYPDQGHTLLNKYAQEQTNLDIDLLEAAYQKVEYLRQHPQKVPVLFGDPHHPYIRIDPTSMDLETDKEAQSALRAFMKAIDNSLQEVVLSAGDICLIDNYKAVHGRKSFQANYDGNDRWLKRLNLVRDLRKSIDARECVTARVIY